MASYSYDGAGNRVLQSVTEVGVLGWVGPSLPDWLIGWRFDHPGIYAVCGSFIGIGLYRILVSRLTVGESSDG